MPILQANADASGYTINGVLEDAMCTAGPIIIMVHGYRYAPDDPKHCPHLKLFSPVTSFGAWPHRLGFGLGARNEGVAIGFGWHARGPLRQVYGKARQAGHQLAKLIAHIRKIDRLRPAHILAHSMGSEVLLHALLHSAPDAVQRVIALTGASFQSTAQAALSSPCGRSVEMINVTSRENDVFDFLFERLIPAPARADRSIAQGVQAHNAVTVQLDHPEHVCALNALGHRLSPSQRRICHWSSYTRAGTVELWSKLMRHPERYPLHLLQPAPVAPRWSRLAPRWRLALPQSANPAT